MNAKRVITPPLTDDIIESLRAGEMVYLTGTVYTARDAAHKRMAEMAAQGEALPFDFAGQIIYYAGPCPNRPGQVIGSIGPTTSGRMDAYTPLLMAKGLRAMIGKGLRNEEVMAALKREKGVYFAAIGGAAALMAQCVTASALVAFADLGTEAIRKLEVVELPLIVAADCFGNDVYRR